MRTKATSPNLENELRSLNLGDVRLNERLRHIVDLVAQRPADSFPDLMTTKAELEALYRLFNNEEVTLEKCLAPHANATAERCRQEKQVLVAHDTTEVAYNGTGRRGLGPLGGGAQGYLAHVSLAMSADGLRRPMGVLAVDTWVRQPKGKKKKKKRFDDPDKESSCWKKNLDESQAQLQGVPIIHLLDRGADSYDLLAKLTTLHFVSRANQDRNVCDPESGEPTVTLRQASRDNPVLLEREVWLNERLKKAPPRSQRAYPPRRRRKAKLVVRASHIHLNRPKGWPKDLPQMLALKAVHVTEKDCPEGETPVEWMLYTSEPIDTEEQVAFIVDCYRARWVIEEFFKALKTGCALLERQFESRHALLNVLGLFLPIAWRLLLLRHTAELQPQGPATIALSERQIDVLKKVSKRPLPQHPTLEQAFLAIAQLGGHLKHNGRPGWLVLGRGYEKLMAYEVGWAAARS